MIAVPNKNKDQAPEPDMNEMSKAIMAICEREAKRLCDAHGNTENIPFVAAQIFAGIIINTALVDLTGVIANIHNAWMHSKQQAIKPALPKIPGMN